MKKRKDSSEQINPYKVYMFCKGQRPRRATFHFGSKEDAEEWIQTFSKANPDWLEINGVFIVKLYD